ncbi:AtuA-related protein [Achromobacter sp. NCFB-sbj8-Ac1-l]|uniref:AtuA-related protein n=1 Tax=unclassified Achromobacter TaxID=2626865 RepID=UPI004046A6B0
MNPATASGAAAPQADSPVAAPRVAVSLYRLGHSRSGDKGDISNLSLIAWDPECYAVLAEQVTEARVAAWFAYRHPVRVTRYLLPTLHAMNFVLEGVLDGGVNDALNLDAHGKSLSFRLLDMTVRVSPALADRLPDIPGDRPAPA